MLECRCSELQPGWRINLSGLGIDKVIFAGRINLLESRVGKNYNWKYKKSKTQTKSEISDFKK